MVGLSGRSDSRIAADLDTLQPRAQWRGRQGTGWDVANAALFLPSNEADFITDVSLPVDACGHRPWPA
jgi:NAD(P)-dependent dehydrogenase (short-subunit alcohol dehydrogenase family)